MSDSPVNYDSIQHAAAVSASVPGSVSNILPAALPPRPMPSSMRSRPDVVPSDTTNYTSLTTAPAGDFVIQEAAPKALMGKFSFDFGSIHAIDPSYELLLMVDTICSPGKGPDINNLTGWVK